MNHKPGVVAHFTDAKFGLSSERATPIRAHSAADPCGDRSGFSLLLAGGTLRDRLKRMADNVKVFMR